MAGFFKNIIGFLAGEKIYHAMDSIKEKINETIEEMEERIEKATIKVMKASVLYIMIFIGFIFLLVGLSQYLNATVPRLANGLGTVLIGAILVFLALFARLFKD
jgi:uncharacterized membrane protein